ncbi:hypothetical protein ANN_03913, partial [Periplaneta americana]
RSIWRKTLSRKIIMVAGLGTSIFRNTMNRNQFCELLRFLRFEEKATRSQRLQTDRFQLLLLYGIPSLPIACYVKTSLVKEQECAPVEHNTQHSYQQRAASKKPPETVMFYNETKCGVDIVDQMARLYAVKYGCRRWPMQVFFNVLDLAAINAWILYR